MRAPMSILTLAVAAMPAALFAQGDSVRQAATPTGPPIRRIATASAISKEGLGNVSSVRELSGGRVLVNDVMRRRLVLMDSNLTTIAVVLDSLSENSNFYGTRAGALIAHRGDSSLFVDPASYALLLLDGEGRTVRVRSVPRVEDVFYFGGGSPVFGWPGIDAKGRLVYRMAARPAPPKVAPPAGVPWIPSEPDSAFIVGIDLDSRKIDTLGVIRIPKTELQIRQTENGGFSINQFINPLPTTDDWAILPNGDIAFVRGRDYRIEYRRADGTITSSNKLPYDWQRLVDEDKQKLVDSVKNAMRRAQLTGYVASMIRWANTYNRPYPAGFTVPEGFALQAGLQKDWKLPAGLTFPANYIYGCAPGEEPTMRPAPGLPVAGAPAGSGAPVASTPAGGPPGAPTGLPSCIPSPIMISGGPAPPPPTMREPSVVPASDLPDYRPPIGTAAVRVDVEGNLWIRTIPAKPTPGGLVYDVINPNGELVDRLQTPPGYTLLGFGAGKVVYLQMRDALGVHVARVRLK